VRTENSKNIMIPIRLALLGPIALLLDPFATLGAAAVATVKPAILLIGDAVTRQYAGEVRELLGARVRTDYLAVPVGPQPRLAEFKAELAARASQYQLLYFALGPEAVRDLDTTGQPVAAGRGKPALNAREFRQWLDDLFRDVDRSERKLIWATAVPVPEGLAGFSAGRIEQYNELATNLAYNRHALLLDLYDYVRIRRDDLQRTGDYMLTATGIELVASVVANKIEEVLLEGNEQGLPHFLVLGDSIVGQYSTFLRERLLHRANVRTGGTAYDAHPDWPAVVARQVTERERELGRPFDLIQFNWGLHALKWAQGSEYSMRFKEGYVRCVPLERYGVELEKLVVELKKNGRRLVWATTTPANNGSQPDDAEAYNVIALEIMRRHGIAVNDLNAFVVNNHIAQSEPRNCHFPRVSAERLGHQVATTLIGLITSGSSGRPSSISPR
jgi:acyl-CoA thioesterase-1